ncbi:MAG: chemotaxis protein CheW [Brevinematia bacterium]
MISIIPVSVNNKLFGIEISYISEIITQKEFFIVPKVPSFTIGLVNIRGEIIPVFNLGTVLFNLKGEFKDKILQNVVLCGVFEKKFCLFVDKIYKVVYAGDESIKSYTENIWKDVKFIKFFVDVKELGSLVGVLDMENIVKYIEKANVGFYRSFRR